LQEAQRRGAPQSGVGGLKPPQCSGGSGAAAGSAPGLGFYNIVLDRPADDPDGVDELYVDAAHMVPHSWADAALAGCFYAALVCLGCFSSLLFWR
jgi:hypothetical protein